MSKLRRFFAGAGEAWTVQALAEHLAMTPGVVRRQLRQLLEEGAIRQRRSGDRWVFEARRPEDQA